MADRRKLPDHARNFRGKAKNIPPTNMRWLPYQWRWIQDQSLLKLMEKGRRTGVTYGTAYERVRNHSLNTCQNDTWFSSRDDVTARLFIRDCMTFAKELDAGAKYLGHTILDNEKGHSAYVQRYSSDTNINSLSSNPDAFAGKGGDVGLDELALRDDPRQVCSIAFPTMDWGGRVSMISTHRGSTNYFNQLVIEAKEKGNPKGLSLHRVTLQDALDQFLLWKLQTIYPEGDPRLDMDEADYFDYQRNRAPDEETFQQEYMCNPADDLSALLGYDLIRSCTLPGKTPIHTEELSGIDGKGRIRRLGNLADVMESKNPLYGGIDIGRDHDLTVFTVFEKTGGIFIERLIIELYNAQFDRQKREIWPILGLPMMRRTCVDNTGLGKQMAEEGAVRFGKYKVERVTFTMPVKEELGYPLRSVFEDKDIRIFDDETTISDLRAVKKEATAAGNIRLTADRGKNGHSDRFWSKALGIHAGKSPQKLNLPPKPRRSRAAKMERAMHAA